ncbi:hypothetical protein OIB37_27010 [Streptomyces sp. NBC_00820]|uniref:hypothetical protein n=1 Tax=Streptomyces sp. NBC_00820 TaxID=2975842 RepID=UPI002ED63D20|nr:hypothetical protein OIB37_27010 [Streptomyces sp. NBC_00820]
MSVGRISSRAKILGLVVILAVLGAGAFMWQSRSGKDDGDTLTAPAEPCWNGTPKQATLQKLLGPGSKLLHQHRDFVTVKNHYPSNCEYAALSDGALDTVLNAGVNWNHEALPTEKLPTADARGDEPRTRMDMGVLAYYLRASQVVFFECTADLPADAPEYMKRDKYIEINVLARPMRKSGLSATEARKVGVDIMLQLARDVAKQAGCTNGTRLPGKVPAISKANWPGYEE